MSTTVTLRANRSALTKSEYPLLHFTPAATETLRNGNNLFTGYESLPETYKLKRMLAFEMWAYCRYDTTYTLRADSIRDAWDASTLTYSTRPRTWSGGYFTLSSSSNEWAKAIVTDIQRAKYIVENGSCFDTSYSVLVYTERSSYKPYLKITFDDTDVHPMFTATIPEANSKVRPNADINFSASLSVSGALYDPDVVSAKFRWRPAGETSFFEYGITPGFSLSYTLPANTSNTGDIEYQFEIVDETGATVTGAWIPLQQARTVVANSSPKDGYRINRAQDFYFSFTLDTDWMPINTTPDIAVSRLKMRTDQTSEYTTLVTQTGGSLAIPALANSLPITSTLQYVIEVEDSGGNVSTGPVYTVSTIDVLPDAAIAISPANTVESGNAPIILHWAHSISSGTPQTKAEIQQSTDGTIWENIATVIGSEQEWEAPPNTFLSGNIRWRVRTYNIDDVPSPWSEALSFLCVSAPQAPLVSAIPSPFPLITWQASEQQAYMVHLSDYDSGAVFGASKSLRIPAILPDGEYTACVKVQNAYGLWSDWGECSVPVNNTPGADIQLCVEASHIAQLSWTNSEDYITYRVLRNGLQIAELNGTEYTDVYSVGATEYQIVGVMSDFNYTYSNAIETNIEVEDSMVLDVESDEWLNIEFSERSNSEQRFTMSRTAQLIHYAGSRFPSVELSSFYSTIGDYNTSFMDRDAAKRFRALLGKRVLLKSREDWVVEGVLLSLTETVGDFYSTFRFKIEKTEADYGTNY